MPWGSSWCSPHENPLDSEVKMTLLGRLFMMVLSLLALLTLLLVNEWEVPLAA